MARTNFESNEHAETSIKLAIGRILRMGARATQPGDIEMYEKCKWVIMDAAEYLGIDHKCTF
jgi:hypothetical protein